MDAKRVTGSYRWIELEREALVASISNQDAIVAWHTTKTMVQLSYELGVNEATLRARWRYLRDRKLLPMQARSVRRDGTLLAAQPLVTPLPKEEEREPGDEIKIGVRDKLLERLQAFHPEGGHREMRP